MYVKYLISRPGRLYDDKLDEKITKACKFLHNAVVEINGSKVANLAENGEKIFEPNGLPDKPTQKGSLQPSRPTWPFIGEKVWTKILV